MDRAIADGSASPGERPNILVFDSGLGGLTVFAEVRKARPDAKFLYVADDAGFPYGRLGEGALVERVLAVMAGLLDALRPAVVIIACNTASTLVLPHLRRRWPQVPFVGTVPAVKPAARLSASKIIAVVATAGTVARDYTRALIADYAADCRVALVGAAHLAALAEAEMRGESVEDAAVAAEIAPCFVEDCEGRRTDVVVLACTHFPLLLPHLERLAPWPVAWIDPAPAIARQAARVLSERWGIPADPSRPAPEPPGRFLFTSGTRPSPTLAEALSARGLAAAASIDFIDRSRTDR